MTGGQDWAAVEQISTSGGDMSDNESCRSRVSDKDNEILGQRVHHPEYGRGDQSRVVGAGKESEGEMSEPREFREWICTKLGLPLDAKDSHVYGAMHVVCSHANGYETYIQAHKCDDKQGEIARLTVEVERLKSELASSKAECERLVAVRNVADARVKQLDGELHDQKRLHEASSAVTAKVWQEHEQQFARQQCELSAAKAEVERLRNYLRDIRHILKSTSPLDLGPRLTCVRLIEEVIAQDPAL